MALRRKDALAALLAGVVLLAMLTTFAIELSNTQAHNQADVRARVHERGALAAALVDGLFSTVSSEAGTSQKLYGGPKVSRRLLDRQQLTNAYLAVLGSNGRILAASRGLTRALRSEMADDVAVKMVLSGSSYGLGNVIPTAAGGVLNFAEAFPSPYGRRILVSGFRPSLLGAFLVGDLRKIPGVTGATNYVIDGHGAVLAATAHGASPGARFSGPYPSGNRNNFSRDVGGRYYDEVRLTGSDWRMVLDSPDGPLYASVSGLTEWLPWIIFIAFAIVGMIAFYLVSRVFSAAAEAREANDLLAVVNRELASTNRLLADRAAELARSNEELDQFASIASHDLQEPLRKVRTFTEQLARTEGDSLSEKGQDYLRRAGSAAERMQTLIEDLLRFSRVSTHARPLERVDLDQIVRDALEDLSEQVETSHADVRVGHLPTILADPLQMRQLMQNLISNALKFRRPEVSPRVEIEAAQAGDDLSLTVRDNGIGFEPRYAQRIFRVFERLHGRTEYSGTGIGLALCRKIVDRHGGTITADGRPGEGATFTITLPLHRAETHNATAARRADRPALEEAHV